MDIALSLSIPIKYINFFHWLKIHFHTKMKKSLVMIENENVDSVDQIARFVQSDLDLHCPQMLLLSRSVRKELRRIESLLWSPFPDTAQHEICVRK